MKIALISVFLATTACATEMLDWPPEPQEKWEEISVSKLPAGVQPKDPEDSDRPLRIVRIMRADVDGDGVADLIVDTGVGGTVGSYLIVYRQEAKGYREVLEAEGGIVIPPKRGKLEFWSRAGGMQQNRTELFINLMVADASNFLPTRSKVPLRATVSRLSSDLNIRSERKPRRIGAPELTEQAQAVTGPAPPGVRGSVPGGSNQDLNL